MLRRLSVRGKILAALAVPVLVLFIASAFIAGQSIGDARVAGSVRDLVDVFPAQDQAIDALQAERAATVAVLDHTKGADTALKTTRQATDTALAARDNGLTAVNTSVLDDRVTSAVQGTLTAASRVATIRRQVDANGATQAFTDESYQAIVATALQVPSALADTVPDRDLARYINAYYLVDYSVSQFTLETSTGAGLINQARQLAGDTTITDAGNSGAIEAAVNFAATIQQDDALVNQANTLLAQLGLKDALLASPTGQYQVLRSALGAIQIETLQGEGPDNWSQLAVDATNQKVQTRDQVRTAVGTQTDWTRNQAVTQALVTIGITLIALALAVVVALAIARQIVRPLRRLTAAASNVREELPHLVEQVSEPGAAPDLNLEQIPVESSDEVGQLARAFNDVNATTLQVAKEQAALRGSIAEMFVNVARRDQVLLNRQLSFLDDLERTEEDPGALSNLFRLDHLATRMRRNAESLLVLAGIDSGRRVRQPMPASDVIRTASSEIEMYDRIRLVLPVDPLMLGHNALSSAHLLAELFENATRFSEPHTPVEVSTNRTAEGVQILIRDYGLGMGPDELREATKRVSAQSASEVLGAQRLGLYVVGRLSTRLGASVQFVSTGENGQGTTAIVNFPSALFVSDSQVPLPQPTDPLSSETQAAVHELSRTAPASLPSRESALPARPSTSAQSQLPTPEPEVAQRVDLEALTDGTTATGMPRRRSARPEPEPIATSTGAGSVVLPPLAAPELIDTFADDTTAWAPPSAPSGSVSLPSRPRELARREPPAESTALSLAPSAASPGELPDATSVDHVAVPDDVVRGSMFSGFRPMSTLDREISTDGDERPVTFTPESSAPEPEPVATLQPEPEPVQDEDSYHALFVPEQGIDLSADESDWAPQFEAGTDLPSRADLPPREAAAESAATPLWEPAHDGTSSPYSDLGGYFGRSETSENPVADPAPGADTTSPGPADTTQETAPAAVSWAAESAAEPWVAEQQPVAELWVAEQQPVAELWVAAWHIEPAVEQSVAAEPDAPTVHEDPFAQQLPAFDDLLTNLPTRRDVREAAKRNRGWFRRGSSQQAYTAALQTLTSPTPVVAAPLDTPWRTPAPYVPGEPAESNASTRAVQPYDDAFTGAPAPAAGDLSGGDFTYVPEGAGIAASAGWQPEEVPDAEESVSWAPQEPTEPAIEDTLDPSRGEHAGPRVVAASPSGRPYRPMELDPLDPTYALDPVAAKSEWLASSVLYEEMNSLLRSSPTLADAPSTGATYQPMVDLETGPTLTRRARREQSSAEPAATTNGIDRDAEVLRERLRAFQSATQRARDEASTGTGSLDLDAEFEAAFGRRGDAPDPADGRGQH